MSRNSSITLNYESYGSGPPLLAVHGWSMCSGVWRYQHASLSSFCRFVSVDLRGHGMSFAPETGYDMEDFESDIVALIRSLDLTDVTLLGWSMGALVTLSAYQELRDRISSLVLVSGTPKFVSSVGYEHGLSEREIKGLSLRLKRKPRQTMDDFFRMMFDPDELSGAVFQSVVRDLAARIRYPSESAALQSLRTLAVTDRRDVLDKIDVPVLLLHGDRDVICPPDASRFMASRIPQSSLKIMGGAGHAPMLSRPNEFNGHVMEFLEKVYGLN